MTVLKTAIATYPHTKGLKDGTVSVPGVQFEHIEVSPIIGAFRRMCRTLEFDVCEMAITTYLTAKAYDKPFTALPVFVVRQFHHSPIVYNMKSGVQAPKDLEGKKVGVRAYTVTTGVWARGILATEYGVDLDKITWVVVDEEHVQEYRKPANVMEQPGANLAEMLVKGELAAAIGVGKVDSPERQTAHLRRRSGRGRVVSEDRHLPHQPYCSSQRRAAPVRFLSGASAVRRLRGRQGAVPERAWLRRRATGRCSGSGQASKPRG